MGSVAQTVVVTGGAPLVETTTASLGFPGGRQNNTRAPFEREKLGPTRADTAGSHSSLSRYNWRRTHMRMAPANGSAWGDSDDVNNSFLLDGTDVNDQANGWPGGAAGTNLGVDTIQEFKIFHQCRLRQSSGIRHGFSHDGGHAIRNQRHYTEPPSSTFETSVLDASQLSSILHTGPPAFRRNQFGGVLGGPDQEGQNYSSLPAMRDYGRRLATRSD